MPVLVSADVPGQTQEGYQATINALGEAIKGAPGFISHFTHPIEGGWRVMELWESSKEAADFFAKVVHPNLPPGIQPQRHVEELHNLVRP